MLLRPAILRSAAPSLRPIRPFAGSAIMPLRAKITNPSFLGGRTMATDVQIPRELPGDEQDDVVFNHSQGVRTIELNRPKKLNTLNGSMVRKIVPRMMEWEKSDMVNVVIMRGAGEKALCAGGDVAVLAGWCQEGEEGRQRSKDYFAEEYKLDHLIASYTKPYISFMDGITMGGGVGLSVHAPFRIATERTMFAMPETSIGFFPEVGGSFFLPRLDGALGTYLSLTSDRLMGVQAFYQGVATHYIHSSSLPDLESRLGELTFKDYASYEERLKIIDSTLGEFVTGLPHDQPIKLAGATRKAIDRIFGADNIDQIIKGLEEEQKSGSELAKWAEKTLATLNERSPTSLKVTLKEMQLGKTWSIDHAFHREHQIAGKFMWHHDFVEGVSAKLIKKPAVAAHWKPETLAEVSTEDVDDFFRIPEGTPRLQLLRDGPGAKYTSYPHAWLSLPNEAAVEAVVKQGKMTGEQVVEHFVSEKGGKIGVKEKVSEIVSRKTKDEGGVAVWES